MAEALSFTKGAQKLHLAQPSLTRQIKDLETEIGVRLLDRTKGHVSLTAEVSPSSPMRNASSCRVKKSLSRSSA